MIGYFFHFGDPTTGASIKSIRISNALDKATPRDLYGFDIETVLIRYFIDGKIMQYPEVKENKIYYSKKESALSADFRIDMERANNISISEAFDYIAETTLRTIPLAKAYCQKKKIVFDKDDILERDVRAFFVSIREKIIGR